MKIAVVGATGLVGRVMLQLLEERQFPLDELIPVASKNSIGQSVSFKDKSYPVVSVGEAIKLKPDIALFSAGGSTSLEWAPKFAENGTTVIDNSSAWRMDSNKKLIVPEINGNALEKNDMIIANPNCSTIQMVVAIGPLHNKYNIKRLVISTYQSVSGTGKNAVDQLKKETNEEDVEKVYPHTIYQNLLPQCDVFEDGGYTKEEIKLIQETRKILNDEAIKITSTAVRVPIEKCHGESINLEFHNEFKIEDVVEILRSSPGLKVIDDINNNLYPMPIDAANHDEVYVGRIRRDESVENGLNLWIVADNLRKGAATNTIQIAETLVQNNLV
ncbi:MAG TPA: aspartate-semialdehyde dehydrogenase [Flavobacteriaceae bacterium]|nr:aspartate-semialdehyde dehydrogenase [Flavobacteriaceae bacterium]